MSIFTALALILVGTVLWEFSFQMGKASVTNPLPSLYYQFSLRTIFIITAIVGAFFGGVTFERSVHHMKTNGNPGVNGFVGEWRHVEAEIDARTRTTARQRRIALDNLIEKKRELYARKPPIQSGR